MGRYILRRTALIAALVLVASSALANDTSPLTPLRNASPINSITQPHYITPRRGHGGSKAWSEEIGQILGERKEIEDWIAKWSTEKGLRKIKLSLNRFFPFRIEINSVLRKSRLPWEIISIPFVESNWRINAVSPSRAAGPWQIIETTARGRGLIIDSWRDERRDVWRSTEAAAKEILFSYGIFQNWPLTIAAYNAGPTRLRALKKEGNFQTFWAMLDKKVIPEETQNYVPQIIAVAYILAHAGRMGLPISWETPTKWLKIRLGRSLHLNQLAQSTGIEKKRILNANQELNHPVTPPASQNYMIKIPIDTDNAKELKNSILAQKDSPERFWRYIVKPGDTLSGVSAAFNIPLGDLRKYNTLVDTGFLREGEQLYIPGTRERPTGVDSDTMPNWQDRYEVSPGDSLWSIAKKYGVSPEQLARVNYSQLGGILFAGTILKVPHARVEQ